MDVAPMPALLGPSPLALLASLLLAAVLAHAAAGGPAAVRAAPAPGRAMDEAALGKKHHDKGHAHGTGIPALEGRRALVTFHGGGGKHDVNEVLAYDLGTGKEWGKLLHDAKHARNLRGLARNLNTNELYVAQAYKDDGAIWTLQLSDSHHHSPKRLLEQKGKRHTYGIALANQDRWLLASNQDTGDVTLFDAGDGRVLADPYVSLSHKDASPRGVAVDEARSVFFLAERYRFKVSCYAMEYTHSANGTVGGGKHNHDIASPKKLFELSVDHPTGLFYEGNSRRLYVSSDASDKKRSNVQAFDLSDLRHPPSKPCAEYKPPSSSGDRLDHPAGVSIAFPGLTRTDPYVKHHDKHHDDDAGGVLLVLGQKYRKLFAFRVSDQEYLGAAVHDLPDDPELLLVV